MAYRSLARRELRRPRPQDPVSSLGHVEEVAERNVDGMLAAMSDRIRDQVAALDDGSGTPTTPAQLAEINRIIDREFASVYGTSGRTGDRAPLWRLIVQQIRYARQVAVDPEVRKLNAAIQSDPELRERLNLPDVGT